MSERIDPDNRPDDFWPWAFLDKEIEPKEPTFASAWWFVVGGFLGLLILFLS